MRLHVRRRRPTNYRNATGLERLLHIDCDHCKHMNTQTGVCTLYSYPVKPQKLCDRYSPRLVG